MYNPNQQRYGFYKDVGDENGEQNNGYQDGCYPGPMHEGEGDSDPSKTNLIVNYLPQYMTDKDLYTMFVTQGPLENVRIMKDYKTGYSFGYGFVKFVRAEDAARAVTSLNGVEYYNKRLKVSYARPPGQDIKDSNLYVTNLPKTITEEQIHNMFSAYGNIVQKNLLKDKITGMPRGVAFVRYSKRDEAQNAIQNLNGKFMDGCMEPICVKVAEEHGRQKATYYEGWKAGYQQNQMKQGPRQPRGSFPRRGNPNVGPVGRAPFGITGRGRRFNPMLGGGDMNLPMNNFI